MDEGQKLFIDSRLDQRRQRLVMGSSIVRSEGTVVDRRSMVTRLGLLHWGRLREALWFVPALVIPVALIVLLLLWYL